MQELLLTGRVGAKPELFKTENVSILSFSIADNMVYWNTKGEKQERTVWTKCKMFYNDHEKAVKRQKTIKAGMSVFVKGRPEVETWLKDKKAFGTVVCNVSNIEYL